MKWDKIGTGKEGEGGVGGYRRKEREGGEERRGRGDASQACVRMRDCVPDLDLRILETHETKHFSSVSNSPSDTNNTKNRDD